VGIPAEEKPCAFCDKKSLGRPIHLNKALPIARGTLGTCGSMARLRAGSNVGRKTDHEFRLSALVFPCSRLGPKPKRLLFLRASHYVGPRISEAFRHFNAGQHGSQAPIAFSGAKFLEPNRRLQMSLNIVGDHLAERSSARKIWVHSVLIHLCYASALVMVAPHRE